MTKQMMSMSRSRRDRLEVMTAEFTTERVKDMAMKPKDAQKYLTFMVLRAMPAKTSDPRMATPRRVKNIRRTEPDSESRLLAMA